MDELATKLVDSLTKVETALETLAPTAFQALVEAAYITGIISIVQGFLVMLIAAGCVVIVFKGAKRIDDGDAVGFPMVIGAGIIGVISGIGALVTLFSYSPWLKALNPTAYVIKSLLNQ